MMDSILLAVYLFVNALILIQPSLGQFLVKESARPIKSEINVTCVPLNSKPRDFFFLYHITHHGGTNMWMLADRCHLPWDGVNSNYNINEGQSKQDVINQWLGNVSYSRYQDGRILPTDMKSWTNRSNPYNLTVEFQLPRRYVSMEKPLYHIGEAVPLGSDKINSMIIMRNPLTRYIKFLNFQKANFLSGKMDKFGFHFRYSNFAIKYLAGLPRVPATVVGEKEFQLAINRLLDFDHIIILEAMDESSRFLCCEWHWSTCSVGNPAHPTNSSSLSIRQHFGNDTMLREILEEEKWDLKLYDESIKATISQLQRMNLSVANLSRLPTDHLSYYLADLDKSTTRL